MQHHNPKPACTYHTGAWLIKEAYICILYSMLYICGVSYKAQPYRRQQRDTQSLKATHTRDDENDDDDDADEATTCCTTNTPRTQNTPRSPQTPPPSTRSRSRPVWICDDARRWNVDDDDDDEGGRRRRRTGTKHGTRGGLTGAQSRSEEVQTHFDECASAISDHTHKHTLIYTT